MSRAGGRKASIATPPHPTATRISRNTKPSVGPPMTAVTVALAMKVAATATDTTQPGVIEVSRSCRIPAQK